ncbi:MAG: hypothetical protein KA319_03395 [Ferruginibacter sp.]|nr:hypothetical protein [Ferruginibacter sp.]
MEELQPLLPIDFTEKMLRDTEEKVDYLAYFKPQINEAINFAIGPFFWFIPDQATMTIIAASENIHQLTPYKKNEWVGKDANFWASNIHPEDRYYVLSAAALAAELSEKYYREIDDKIRINIYCRMLDANYNFRWVLMQFPNRYYNKLNKICSTWVMITDLSHIGVFLNQNMMTVIDTSNDTNQYFSVSVENKELTSLALPHITKREQQVLQLMAKGLNSPAIAKELFLSYHTVEKHKRNLRVKTNTKTSAELMAFVCRHNLF